MSGKGMAPRKGYNYQRYADNYDQIFRQPTTQPKQLKPMKTNQDGLQPAPVLPWHRKAAHKIIAAVNPQIAAMRDNPQWEPGMYGQRFNDAAAIIAAHDPHAETVRLLERTLRYIEHDHPNDVQTIFAQAIRAHLAKLKGTP